jgi:O-antigen biosynthesis protein WbqP
MYGKFFKRILDVVLSSIGLILLSPLMLVVSLFIILEDRGPVIFRQRRVGKEGANFQVLKFRSMPVNTGDVESAKANGLAITRTGRIIRRTNIDEIPQLWNVLRGEMSLVGPRPPLPSQEALCRFREANGALRCAPGLTGLAQINGYDGMPDAEKAAYDGKYASSISFLTDLRIVLKTLGYIRRRPPVY